MTDHPAGEALQEYACDELTVDAAETVATHVAGCEACRREVEAMRRMFADLDSLPRELFPTGGGAGAGGVPPLRDLPVPNRLQPPLRARPAWRAAAAVILLGLSVWVLASVTTGGGTDLADAELPPGEDAATGAAPSDGRSAGTRLAEYRSITEELLARVEQRPDARESAVTTVLASLDRAVADTERALDRIGEDPVLEEMLVRRYEQRIALLRQSLAPEATW